MQFTAHEDESEERIWELILTNLSPEIRNIASASTSSFFKTADGIECHVRKTNGLLLASCYSESDRMGHRRWTIEIK